MKKNRWLYSAILLLLICTCLCSSSASFRTCLSRKLFRLSLIFLAPEYYYSEKNTRVCVTPIRPGEWGNCDSRFMETVKRGVTYAGCFLAYPAVQVTSFFGKTLQVLGHSIDSTPYYEIRGSAPESLPGDTVTLFQWNVCMFWGGLPIDHGGLSPAVFRMKQVGDLIKAQQADFVLLQEVAFSSGLLLSKELKESYPYMYTFIGPDSWRLGACLFFASKSPPVSPPIFEKFKKGHAKGNMRGFFCFETPSYWLITTHMEYGNDRLAWEIRKDQLEQMRKKAEELKSLTGKTYFISGDLNFERTKGNKETNEYLFIGAPDYFYDQYAVEYPEFNAQSATCTDLLQEYIMGKEIPEGFKAWEIDDYLLVPKEDADKFKIRVDLITDAFNLEDPQHALSDHRGLRSVIQMK